MYKMREQKFAEAVKYTNNRLYNDAAKLLKEILTSEEKDTTHYKALKLYADIVGPVAGRDYITAIDMYQVIINETEDDDLYSSAQISILNAYLSLSIDMMDAYESTRDVIETEDQKIVDLLSKLDDKRETFLTQRAEIIYKNRM